MWRLEPPSIASSTSYDDCKSKVRSPLRTRLDRARADVLGSCADYDRAAARHALHQVPAETIPDVEKQEAVRLYESGMVRKTAPGRWIYDELMRATETNGLCPLCGSTDVGALDHHLPKSTHHRLVVAPTNLIPSCKACNENKLELAPTTAGGQTIHPYFDDVDGFVWLVADVVAIAPAAVVYRVDPQHAPDVTTAERLEHHFNTFKLRKRFASLSANELSNIRGSVLEHRSLGGPKRVRSYLDLEARSRHSHRTNSWQAALYRGLLLSDDYLERGQ